MAFTDKYILGYSQEFAITGTEQVIEKLNLADNQAINSENITGKVTSWTAPISKATVQAFDMDYNLTCYTKTNQCREFKFENILKPGKYMVMVLSKHYIPSEPKKVIVRQNKKTIIKICLHKYIKKIYICW